MCCGLGSAIAMDPTHYQPGDLAALRSIGRWCRRWLGLADCPEHADRCASPPTEDASTPPLSRAGRWPDAKSLMAGRIPAVDADHDTGAQHGRMIRGRDSEDA